MIGCNYFRKLKKHCTLKETVPVIKHNHIERKNVFKEQLLPITVIIYELLFH